MNPLTKLRKQIRRAKAKALHASTVSSDKYKYNPRLYAKEKLGIILTDDQEQALIALVTPPYKVIVRAGHTTGKSTLMAVAISWIYDTRKKLFGIITAPKESQIKNIVWRELRKMRKRNGLGGFTGPASLTIQDADDHIFTGTTARDTEGFQGKHEENTYVFMDEASGIEPEFFQAAETMVGGVEYGELITLNPLSTACQAYREERSGRYKVITMSCLDHPNIPAELRGDPPPYPSAVRLQPLIGWIKKWADPISHEDAVAPNHGQSLFTAFEFPKTETEISESIKCVLEQERIKCEYLGKNKDGKWVVGRGQWWRAGPECESRVLGVWPSSGVNTIWSELLFKKCRENIIPLNPKWRVAIGCDVARYGDDLTEMWVRQGPCVIHGEAHSGWALDQVTGRLKQLCHQFPGPEAPRKVRVFIDETGGLGAGPVDFADGYNFFGINVAKEAQNAESYVDTRTELWFNTRDMARSDIGLDFSRLTEQQAYELERQFLAQKYKINPKTGQSVAISKDDTKKELGRSPDGADGVNLSFVMLG